MKKLFDIIKLYWGYIATVAAIAGSAWGLKSDIEKKAIKEYSGQVKEISYEGKIDKLIVSDSLKTITLEELKASQSEILAKQDETKTAFNSLRSVVLDHQATTIEEFKKLNNEVPELKKNFSPIVRLE
jgi:hypothetical protein